MNNHNNQGNYNTPQQGYQQPNQTGYQNNGGGYNNQPNQPQPQQYTNNAGGYQNNQRPQYEYVVLPDGSNHLCVLSAVKQSSFQGQQKIQWVFTPKDYPKGPHQKITVSKHFYPFGKDLVAILSTIRGEQAVNTAKQMGFQGMFQLSEQSIGDYFMLESRVSRNGKFNNAYNVSPHSWDGNINQPAQPTYQPQPQPQGQMQPPQMQNPSNGYGGNPEVQQYQAEQAPLQQNVSPQQAYQMAHQNVSPDVVSYDDDDIPF